MSSIPSPARASRSVEAQRATLLGAIGAWNIAVPYLATALGLDVNVEDIVEVVDHAVPGAIVVAAALFLRKLARRGRLAGQSTALIASGIAFLAGFWVLATHVPLWGDAADSAVSWEAAIWHSIASLPIVALAVWFVVRSIPEP